MEVNIYSFHPWEYKHPRCSYSAYRVTRVIARCGRIVDPQIMYLQGILPTNKWEKDGITYYTAKIVVQDCRFLAPNAENSEGSTDEGVNDVVSDKVTLS